MGVSGVRGLLLRVRRKRMRNEGSVMGFVTLTFREMAAWLRAVGTVTRLSQESATRWLFS